MNLNGCGNSSNRHYWKLCGSCNAPFPLTMQQQQEPHQQRHISRKDVMAAVPLLPSGGGAEVTYRLKSSELEAISGHSIIGAEATDAKLETEAGEAPDALGGEGGTAGIAG